MADLLADFIHKGKKTHTDSNLSSSAGITKHKQAGSMVKDYKKKGSVFLLKPLLKASPIPVTLRPRSVDSCNVKEIRGDSAFKRSGTRNHS